MKLRILAIGKLKDPGLEALVAEWTKRSRAFLPIEVLHVRDLAALRAKAVAPRVVLDERGEQVRSPELAAWLLGPGSAFMTGQVLRPDGGLSSVRTFA